MTRALMLQGTGSDVGKSLLAAGLARAFTTRGLTVMPFKPQNMSNNAAVTADGGEIGRAQALQARAARVSPSVHMNPVLLKPESDTGAQVIVQGRRVGTLRARDYIGRKAALLPPLLEAGVIEIERRTGWPGLGVAPWLPDAAALPAEDALDLARPASTTGRAFKVAVPVCAHIANFDDLDPLGQEPDVSLALVRA